MLSSVAKVVGGLGILGFRALFVLSLTKFQALQTCVPGKPSRRLQTASPEGPCAFIRLGS